MVRFIQVLAVVTAGLLSSLAVAGDLSVPHDFVAGTRALASEVNDNFTAVETAVNDNNSRITQLENEVNEVSDGFTAVETAVNDNDERITRLEAALSLLQAQLVAAQAKVVELETQLTSVVDNSVLALDKHLSLATDDQGHPVAVFSGVNVNVNNGMGRNDQLNGMGNLSIGYNELKTIGPLICSKPQYINQTDCEANAAVWSRNHRGGSHNLVIGRRNSYASYGGMVVGDSNSITGSYAVVSGGAGNLASGASSSVSGGANHSASGVVASVSGGFNNTASGMRSSVSGGDSNQAGGESSSISGGSGRSLAPGEAYWWRAGPYFTDNLNPHTD